MSRRPKSTTPANTYRRPAPYRPDLERLEGRFYPGDTFALASWSLLGHSLGLLDWDRWLRTRDLKSELGR
jgi:hypothetical protein